VPAGVVEGDAGAVVAVPVAPPASICGAAFFSRLTALAFALAVRFGGLPALIEAWRLAKKDDAVGDGGHGRGW
jgi:hypothetical protein